MRQLTLKLFEHLQGPLGNSTVYALEDKKHFEYSAVQQFYFMASALPIVIAALEDETSSLRRIERPGLSSAKVVQLDGDGNAAREEASSRVDLCLKEGLSVVYKRGE